MKKSDYVIIGAGLAGLSLAYFLCKNGKSCTILERGKIGSGASGVPLGLANPATALNAKLSWESEKCLSELNSTIDDVQQYADSPIIVNRGIYRIASSQKLLDKFHSAYKKNEWPNSNWAEWISPEDVKSKFPEISEQFGALYVSKGLSINVPLYLTSLAQAILSNDCHLIENAQIRSISDNRIQFSYNQTGDNSESDWIETEAVIWCTGIDLIHIPELTDMRLHGVLGQLDTYRLVRKFLPAPISSLGYMDQTSDNKIYIGSTYNHHFSDITPTKKASEELTEKLQSLFPNVELNEQDRLSWVGVRTSTKDRMPIVGQFDKKKPHYVLGGFGSKGLLYSSFVSQILCCHLITGYSIPQEINVNRFISK